MPLNAAILISNTTIDIHKMYRNSTYKVHTGFLQHSNGYKILYINAIT